MEIVHLHRGYELRCTARALDTGLFVPELQVTRQTWPTRPRVIAVPRGEHRTEQAATEAALRTGLTWVDDYGVNRT